MDIFIKATAAVLVGVVLSLVLAKQNKENSLLITVLVCCLVCITAMNYFHQLIEFMRKLERMGGLDPELFSILLKAVGIGLLAEISALICADFGNGAMGKTLQILAVIVILWISLPLLNKLMDLISGILEAI